MHVSVLPWVCNFRVRASLVCACLVTILKKVTWCMKKSLLVQQFTQNPLLQVLCIFQTILFLEQLLDFADTAGAMLLTQGTVNFHWPVFLLGWYRLTVYHSSLTSMENWTYYCDLLFCIYWTCFRSISFSSSISVSNIRPNVILLS